MTDVVLTRPGMTSNAEARWAGILPLGLAYLAASLRANGVKVKVVDGKLGRFDSSHQHATIIASHRPKYVGISAMTVDFLQASNLAQILQKQCGAITILGGSHANAVSGQALIEAPGFDFVIAGEGEQSLPELVVNSCSPNSIKAIPGLYFRGGSGEICTGAPARFDTDLEVLPFPAWDLFPRMTTYPVMWERGCPYKCVFCCHNMTRLVRTRSVEHILEEIDFILRNFSPRIISFQDETFGLDHDKTLALLEKLVAIHNRYGVRFTAQSRVDKITDELAKLMYLAGFAFLELGVESGNAEVLALSGKTITLAQVEHAVKVARRNKIKIWLKFILGLPGETLDTIRDTVKIASRLRPHRISISIIVAYPGCDIYTWAKEERMGYRMLTERWDNFDKYASASVELENLPYPILRKWQVLAYLFVYIRGFRIFEIIRLLWLGRSIIVKQLLQGKGLIQ